MAGVRLENLRKVHDDGTVAVHGVDLRIDDGDFCVLLGPSGCGKSTVLRMIAGLDVPSGGTVYIGGRAVESDTPQQRDIAMAFQEHALYPHLTVAQNIGYPLRRQGVRRRVARQRVADVARQLGLTDVLDRIPSTLSGGQQQRVALGRSIVRRPNLFLMDEPLSNLDARRRIRSRSEILKIQRDLDTTTVFVTHDQVEAMAMADQVVIMRAGHVVQSGRPLDVYRHPADLFVARFLGAPAMNTVLATVRRIDDGHLSLDVGSQRIALADTGWSPQIADQHRDRDVVLGIRPESIHRNSAPRGCNGPIARLIGSVESIELFGSDQVIHTSVDAPAVHIDDDPDQTDSAPSVASHHRSTIASIAHSDDRVDMWQPDEMFVDTDDIHLFDLDTGRSLRPMAPA